MTRKFQYAKILQTSTNLGEILHLKVMLSCAILLFMMLALSACSGDKHDDLEAYIQQVKLSQKGRIPPIPEIQRYETFAYESDTLRDPFSAYIDPEELLKQQASSGLGPKAGRKREPLEQFPLDALLFVGHLEKNGVRWGLISAPDDTVYRIQTGRYIGQNFGEILEISETSIKLKELVPDGAGGWVERSNALTLIESE